MAIIPQIITEDRASGAQVIDGSLKFDKDLTYYLTKTLSSVGNQRTFTFSCWCKRSSFGTHSALFSSSGNGDFFKFSFRDDNRFEINTTDGGVDSTHLFSTARFRDTSWYHIVIAFDTTQVTSTNRVKFYVNNTQITDFDLGTYPGQNADTSANDNVQHIIGNQVGTTRYFDGMISNVHMIDGQQLAPTEFGFTDPLTGTWRPKKYTGTYGTNGFYLPMDGNSSIGEDKSGRGNNWTPVNFGGSMDITKATGALPILNTVNGGRVATVGVRTDAYASNLVLAVPLNGNTQDYSGRINNSRTSLTFSVNGDAAPTTAQSNFYGGSYTFDGTTDSVYSTVPNSDALFLQNSNFTVECWARIASGQTDDRYFITLGSGSATNNDGSWYLRIFQSKFEGIFVNGGTQVKTISANNYVADKWTHIAYVREGNEQRLYVDGILSGTNSESSLPNLNNSSTLFIGSAYGYNNTINAQIQDARIYDNVAKYTSNFIPAATKPDILPDTPSGIAYSSELKQITEGSVNGGVSNGDTLLVGNSSDFNFGSGDFTVELFAYHTSTAGNDTLVGMWNSGANRRTWMIDIEADQGRLRGYWSTDGSAFSNVQTATGYIARHKWNHIVFCRQGNTMRLYLNGNQEATATESSSLYNNVTDSLGILSATDVGNDPCNGHISNVRILKGTCLYPDGTSFTPPSAPLTNVSNTKLLCCQSKTMSSISDAAVLPSYDITVKSSNSGSGNTGSYTAITSSGNYYYDNRPSQGGTGSAWIQIDFASTQSSVTSIKLSGGGYAAGSTYDLYVNGVLVENDRSTVTLWAEDTITISSTNIDSIRIEGSDGYSIGAVKFNDTLVSGSIGGITVTGNVFASAFNPFTDDINAVRGQETGYCTLNPLSFNKAVIGSKRNDAVTFSDNNLTSTVGATNNREVVGNIVVSSGKYYFEAMFDPGGSSNNSDGAGWVADSGLGVDNSTDGGFCMLARDNGSTVIGNGGSRTDETTGTHAYFNRGDVMGCAIDLDSRIATWYRNGGKYSFEVDFSSRTNLDGQDFKPMVLNRSAGSAFVNFGQKPFKFPPPDGFQPLCLANLPRPTKAAVRPDKYFNTVLYTGTGVTNNVTGLGFKPDFVWVKKRNLAEQHELQDSVRGATKRLASNLVASETTVAGSISSFDSDGFTVVDAGSTNENTHTYVGWAWKAGGNSSTFNIDGRGYATAAEAGLDGGTITPTGASVNTESGFSIITYTGDGNTSSGVTINHGLGDTPAFIITKKRSSGTTDYGWSCWHKDLGGNYGIWLHLGNTRNPSMWAGYTNISSTVFSPPDLNYGNENTQTYVNYLWSEVPGFSKFGTYLGNGAVDGPLIECGFRPAWVMVKVAGGSTGNSWTVWDNKRDTHNQMDLYLHPNETQEDGTYVDIKMDFYANGFKPRGNIIHQNSNGVKYIYMALADVPTINLYGGQANAR